MTGGPDDPVVLAVAPDDFAARAIAAVLADAEIESIVEDGTTPLARPFSGAPGESVVFVRRADEDRARAVVAERRAEAEGIEWSEVDLGAREDDYPLRPSRGMPMAARIAFAVAVAVAAVALIGGVLVLVL